MRNDFPKIGSGLLVLIGAIAVIFLLTNKTNSEITAYPVLCHNDIPTIYDCKDATPLNRTTYKVDKKNQEVVSWMPNFEDIILIDKYKKCVVIDVKNWTCEYDDNSGKFGFNKGNFISSFNPYYNEIYVTKSQWKRADGKIDYLETIPNF